MAGASQDKGNRGIGSKPSGGATPAGGASTPQDHLDCLALPQTESTHVVTFREDVAALARKFFPGNLDAPHAITAAGVFALIRAGISHWIDGTCPDADFVKGRRELLGDLKGLPLTRLTTFMRDHSADIERIAELLRGPPSAATEGLGLPHVVILTSLIHTKRNLLRGASLNALVADDITALDLARRMDPHLLDEWKGVVRHMLRAGIDGLGGDPRKLSSEAIAWQYANPCTVLFPILCAIDSPKTFVGGVLEGSKSLLAAGVLPSYVDEAKQLSSEAAANLLGRAVAAVDDIVPKLTKDTGNAHRTLRELLGQLAVSDRLLVLEILATDSRTTEIARRLESYGVLKSDVRYASWLIVHRERMVECGEISAPFAEHLFDLVKDRPGIRPALVALISWSDRFAEADLIGATLTLIKSRLDPNKVEQRIHAAGAAIERGAHPAEARAILERGVAPMVTAPADGGCHPAGDSTSSSSRPIQTILQERLAALPDLQVWVARTFEGSHEQPELQRCLRRLSAMPPEVTPRFAAFLHDYGSEPRCREFLAAPPAFERLTKFLTTGRHEEIREFKLWLRGDVDAEPGSLSMLRGIRTSRSAAIVAAEEEERGEVAERTGGIVIPPGYYKRLVVVGGFYSPPKRAAIQESAGEIPVLFVHPDDDSRAIRQTLAKNDLVVINPTYNSHSTSDRVIAQCRANDITWVMVPFFGYKAVASIAERMQP